MKYTASDIITRAARLAIDETNAEWGQQVLLNYLNDARSVLFLRRPDLYEIRATQTLAAGARQALPTDVGRMFRAIANVTHASKRQITTIDEQTLAKHRPSWRQTAPATLILHIMYDERDGSHYEVYPPAAANTQIEVSYPKSPAKVLLADITTTDLIEGEEAEALVDYVLGRAFQEASESQPALAQRAEAHMRKFDEKFPVGAVTKAAAGPNAENR